MSINPFAVVAVLGHIIRRATLLKQISIVLKTYFKSNALKLQKNENEIWQSIKVKGLTVIDFGIGESTEKLAELGARVIVVDKDLEKIKRYNKNPRVDIV
jgi:2-polyprenyl-3-methyl-5-hydroxy-6-metoxy-1,4-benzoquinol methylase